MIDRPDQTQLPLLAATCLWRGLNLLSHKRIRKYLWAPILINLSLYSIALVLGYHFLSDWLDSLIPAWLSWLEWILWPVLLVSFLTAGFFTFTLLANVIAAPFYCRLAYQALAVVSGQPERQLEQPLLRVVAAELKRVVYFFSRMLPLLLLFVIPGVNIVAPGLWMLFGAWSLALEFMAYPLENRGYLFAQQREMLKTVRLAALSFGGLTMLGLSIPILNLLMSPAAVVGATEFVYLARLGRRDENLIDSELSE